MIQTMPRPKKSGKTKDVSARLSMDDYLDLLAISELREGPPPTPSSMIAWVVKQYVEQNRHRIPKGKGSQSKKA